MACHVGELVEFLVAAFQIERVPLELLRRFTQGGDHHHVLVDTGLREGRIDGDGLAIVARGLERAQTVWCLAPVTGQIVTGNQRDKWPRNDVA